MVHFNQVMMPTDAGPGRRVHGVPALFSETAAEEIGLSHT